MRHFMINKNKQITNSSDDATHLFEEVDSYANGTRWSVQTKNEVSKRWGGNGEDVDFTVYNTKPSRQQIVSEYFFNY